MATPTYDPIASTTLTSSAASVTFSSLDTIAAGYRDLVLVADTTGDLVGYSKLQVNGDTASNYSLVFMRGDGSATNTNAFTANTLIDYPVFFSGEKILIISHFMDFSATNKHKTVLTRAHNINRGVNATAGRWANTAAITSITLSFTNFNAGSVFSLYGIVA